MEGREGRKFELVVRHIETSSEERGRLILARYLDTNPGAEWVERMALRFPALFEAAQAFQRGQEEALRSDRELLRLLRFEEPLSAEGISELDARIESLKAVVPDVERVVQRTLKGEDEETLLVAAALALHLEMSELMSRADLAGHLVVSTVVGSPIAGPMAAFAAVAEPELAQNVFSKFLVNVLLDKNPDPPMEEGAERRAIVACRTMLPLLRSPVPDVDYVDADAVALREVTRRAYGWASGSKG